MKMFHSFAVLGFFALSAAAFGAEFTIDQSHSTVGFEIKHMVSKVRGQFNDFSGEFTYDEKKPAAFKLNATIQTKSINTSNEKRDNHLRGADFFDAEKNPTITYVGKKLTKTGKDKFKVDGDLTMHGVTKPVTLNVEFTGEAIDPWGNRRGGLTAKGVVKRKDFGIVWNKVLDKGGLMLGEDVDLSFSLEATEKKSEEKKSDAKKT